MLQRVMIDNIELPRLYIAENAADVELAMSRGIPFIRWRQGQEALIKMLLRPVLERMFPSINWVKVLGPRKKFRTKVTVCKPKKDEPDQLDIYESGRDMDSESVEHDVKHDVEHDADIEVNSSDIIEEDGDIILVEDAVASSEERLFSGSASETFHPETYDIEDYIGDMSSYVNIEMLQRLKLMPAFIGDILDCVKINMSSGLYWREGYNKRLGLPVGRFNSSGQLPNLVILDVSGSIPRGISATMISLIDTLRTQLSADLIITASISRFYPMSSELPTPNQIRHKFGYGNEAGQFFGILADHICGRHYGHVFSFGDNDTPEYFSCCGDKCPSLAGTMVECVHHYHTGVTWRGEVEDKTGYAKWCHMLAKKPTEEYDTSWCSVIFDN